MNMNLIEHLYAHMVLRLVESTHGNLEAEAAGDCAQEAIPLASILRTAVCDTTVGACPGNARPHAREL